MIFKSVKIKMKWIEPLKVSIRLYLCTSRSEKSFCGFKLWTINNSYLIVHNLKNGVEWYRQESRRLVSTSRDDSIAR
jgi:hypothetical protein